MSNATSGMGRAIVLGSLAVTLGMLLGFALMEDEALAWSSLTYVPFLVFFVLLGALAVVSLAAVCIGLPTVVLLGKMDCLSGELVAVLGTLAGTAVSLLPVLLTGQENDPFNWVLVIAAMMGGGVTGAIWGIRLDRPAQEDLAQPLHPNRLHDERMLR